MKQITFLIALIVVAVLAVGCNLPSSEPAAEPAAVENAGQAGVEEPVGAEAVVENADDPAPPGDGSQPNADPAIGTANQLAMQTLYLQDTDYPVSADQAATLLPLWESVQEQMNGEAPDTAAIEGLLGDIESTLTAEQQGLLANLDQETLQAWMQEQGMFGGNRGGAGGQGGGPGGGSERPEGTPPADGGGNRGGTARQGGGPMIAAVIEMLESTQ